MSKEDIIFEEALQEDWSRDLDFTHVSVGERPALALGFLVALAVVAVGARLGYLGFTKGDFYSKRAEANVSHEELLPAPRGVITDRKGVVLAENRPVFSALLDVKEFLRRRDLEEETLAKLMEIGVSREEVADVLADEYVERSAEPAVVKQDLTQEEVVMLKAERLPTILVQDSFEREYPAGQAFAAVVGYIGAPDVQDLVRDPERSARDFAGRAGVERSYDDELRGTPGVIVNLRDAKGNVLGREEKATPEAGGTLVLSVDAEFQKYFSDRMAQQLAMLGRTSGAGIALDPRNGEVLALISLPSYDPNIMSGPGRNDDKRRILSSDHRPLFNRAISGLYTPGSTIKPLVGLAALKEGVVDPEKTVFSPGYLDIPNPYDPDRPTRYLDWRYQGTVDLASAIAQSSNVYFYSVVGGAFDIKGLGIERLRKWWSLFNLDKVTGIDLPGEVSGFLPSIEWKEEKRGRRWLLGDTYNVSIGQGDLLVTPLALLNYIAAIANGGTFYEPRVARAEAPGVLGKLPHVVPEIEEVRTGMRETVTSLMGTAHLLADLPVSVAAKTGSAQVANNTQENAFFVGYAPVGDPQIAILILIENSREGSLNAVPVAKDVLAWYYGNRLKK